MSGSQLSSPETVTTQPYMIPILAAPADAGRPWPGLGTDCRPLDHDISFECDVSDAVACKSLECCGNPGLNDCFEGSAEETDNEMILRSS